MNYINNNYSKNINMKTTLYIIVFLLLLLPVYSEGQDKAIVTLTIINLPPVIKNVTFGTSEVYSDMKISCNADVHDENVKKLKFNYY
ncbi:MAG: hypothetical protein QXG00_05555 [Candidatus Woesearchaeota archaeon]